MLWTAIACLQREERDAVCVVYTGDVVSVSKEDMIDKVQVRSSCTTALSVQLLIASDW